MTPCADQTVRPLSRPSLAALFLGLLRLGLTAFGGPVMILHIRALAVQRKGWLTEEEFRLGMGSAQMIPGATAMQVAAYVGLRSRGGLGALAAYVGFGLPAFGFMLGLSYLYFYSRDLPRVLAALSGLQLAVTALVLHAALGFARQYVTRWVHGVLALGAGVWLGMGQNPILALVAVCVLAAFLFTEEQGRVPLVNTRPTSLAPVAGGAAFLVAGLGALWFLHPSWFDLAAMMARIDAFAFGGGYVSLPIMLHEVAGKGLMSESMLMDGFALGQVTPGPIVMTATFVGYGLYGWGGGIVATIAVFTPSYIAMCVAVPFCDRLMGSAIARRMLTGSLITLVGLMAAMGARFALNVDWGVWEAVIGLGVFAALWRGVDIIWVVPTAAVLAALVL